MLVIVAVFSSLLPVSVLADPLHVATWEEGNGKGDEEIGVADNLTAPTKRSSSQDTEAEPTNGIQSLM